MFFIRILYFLLIIQVPYLGSLFQILTQVPYLGSLSFLGSLGSLSTSLIKLGAGGVFYVPLVALARLFGKLSLSVSLSPYSVLLGARP